MTWYRLDREGLVLYRSDLLDSFGEIGHAVSTRVGGVSSPPYASLNLALGTGDDPERVRQNRSRFCASAGSPLERVTTCRQVLGAEIVEADGVHSEPSPAADALITDHPGVPLLTLSADCVLVLLYDSRRRCLSNIHSSRRGTFLDLCTRAISAMTDHYGSRPADLVAAVAPSIGPCCYEVGEDIEIEWKQRHPWSPTHFHNRRLDLWGAIQHQLMQAGIPERKIDVARVCTKCSPESFYSYRREGERSGRFGALLWLK